MTVEASLLVPVFLFFFITLCSSLEMLRLHGNMQLALWNTGRKLSVYEYALSNAGESDLWQEMKDAVVTYTYVREELSEYLGEDYLNTSPLEEGIDSLQFWESEVFTDDGGMELIVTYGIEHFAFRMANRYYGHVWNGYDIANGKKVHRDIVYVAEYGEVYHEDRSCTHLRLSVMETSMERALAARNNYGKRYTACEKCAEGSRYAQVYITEEGDCYHYDRLCSGLKRTVFEMQREQAEKYAPCSRCTSDN